MQEKLDGIFAEWTGEHFITRGRGSRQKLNPPKVFKQLLPADTRLFGELWYIHPVFQRLSNDVHQLSAWDWTPPRLSKGAKRKLE